METKEELRLHLCFFLLFVCAHYLDPLMEQVVTSWHPPKVTFFSFVVALIWLAGFTILKLRLASDRIKVLQARLDKLEFEPSSLPPEDFARFIRQESERWTRVIRRAGITLE